MMFTPCIDELFIYSVLKVLHLDRAINGFTFIHVGVMMHNYNDGSNCVIHYIPFSYYMNVIDYVILYF